MSSKSLKNHLKSTKYDSHQIRKDNQKAQKNAEIQCLNNAYQGASMPNLSTSSIPLNMWPGMFAEDVDMLMDGSSHIGPRPLSDGPLIPISVPEYLTFNPEDEREHLHHQYTSMLEQAFSADDIAEEESDEATTYLADEFRTLGMWIILTI